MHETVDRRTELYSKSFITSTTQLWNDTESEIKDSTSLNVFKTRIKDKYQAPIVRNHFLAGNRYTSVLYAKLRNTCTDLITFRNHKSDSQKSDCSHLVESAEHLFPV